MKARNLQFIVTDIEGKEREMPKLSPVRAGWPVLPGLKLLNRGKVRDSNRLPVGNRLVVATDGISAKDFVVNALVKHKGIVLSAMTVFWLQMMDEYGIPHHMVAYGSGIDEFLPPEHRGNIDLQARAMVVKELRTTEYEFVVRGCLAGTAVPKYQKTGEVCGHRLPPGLQDGDELPSPILTPTTKAEEGHDENVPAEEVILQYPVASMRAMQIYQIGRDYARKHGIEQPDTKFEFAEDGTLVDEVLTPDSSRFWPYVEWLLSRKPAIGRRAPGSFDKDPVRKWLSAAMKLYQETHGVKELLPEIPEHVDIVHSFVMPEDLIARTTQAYRYIFWRLTGHTIEHYLREVMHVDYPVRKVPNVLLVLGSDTDLPEVRKILGGDGMCSRKIPSIKAHVMSCHRNPEETRILAEEGLTGFDIAICIGGKALALAGVLDSWAHYYGVNVPVAAVALGDAGSKSLLAAQLSIEEIPGQPVIIDEIAGGAYTGPAGLSKLLDRVAYGELPPPKPRKEKPVQLGISLC